MALCVGKVETKSRKKTNVKSKRPPGPYAIFVRSKKYLYNGKIGEFAKKCSEEWRKLSEEERNKFREQANSIKKNKISPAKKSDYLKFVSATYQCLRNKHPDWSAKRIRQQLMNNYKKLKCKCSK